jgi:hypothetical protein
MRIEPAELSWANVGVGDTNNAPLTPSAITIVSVGSGTDGVVLEATVTGATQYRPYFLQNNNNAAGYVALGSEL